MNSSKHHGIRHANIAFASLSCFVVACPLASCRATDPVNGCDAGASGAGCGSGAVQPDMLEYGGTPSGGSDASPPDSLIGPADAASPEADVVQRMECSRYEIGQCFRGPSFAECSGGVGLPGVWCSDDSGECLWFSGVLG